jgi:CheY-like chemotaxis protein
MQSRLYPSVLVVDDNPQLGMLVMRLLNILGFDSVEIAADTTAARTALSTMRISLVLCDLELPGGDGLDLLRWCRGRENLARIPFVICEETFSFESVLAAAELGADGILLKPYDSDLFRRKVRQAVSGAAKRLRQPRPGHRPGYEPSRTFAQSLYGLDPSVRS